MKQKIIKFFSTIEDNNIAFHVSNDASKVINNRKELCNKNNVSFDNLKYMNQIHSNKVVIVNDVDEVYECDALITNKINTPLLVMVADCIPILFYDEVNNVIALAHAGRNGTFLNISSNVIKKMKEEFFSKAENIIITMGPSIQKCCYQVSEELEDIAIKNFGEQISKNRYLDLQRINKNQLLDCGIIEENISISNICTKCSNKAYYSYRKNPDCGRFAGVISLF